MLWLFNTDRLAHTRGAKRGYAHMTSGIVCIAVALGLAMLMPLPTEPTEAKYFVAQLCYYGGMTFLLVGNLLMLWGAALLALDHYRGWHKTAAERYRQAHY